MPARRRPRPSLSLLVGRTVRVGALTAWLLPVFVVQWLREVFRGRDGQPSLVGPRTLRRYLEACGGSFVKVGQVLAMRFDLLPETYCEQLSRLLDQVPGVEPEIIRAEIERDLDRPIDACFASFEMAPLASASIAQVHAARLHDGRSVVVKVRRPGIADVFGVDFLLMRLLVRLFAGRLIFVHIDLPTAIEETIRLTREELDLRREARSIAEMNRLLRHGVARHCAPAVIDELCGDTVITMERLRGVSANAMIAAIRDGDQAALDQWAEQDITADAAAPEVLRSLLIQVLRLRVFQADPHAANIILLPGGRVGWVDFGMLGRLDERAWKEQFRLRLAIADGRIDAAFRCLLVTLQPLPSGDLSRFEAEVKSYLWDWITASRNPASSFDEKSANAFFLRTFGAIRRAQMKVPMQTMRLYRAMMIADMVVLKLSPSLDMLDVVRRLMREEVRHHVVSNVGGLKGLPQLAPFVDTIVTHPQIVADLLDHVHRDWTPSRLGGLSRLEMVVDLLLSSLQKLTLVAVLIMLSWPWLVESWPAIETMLPRLSDFPERWPVIVVGIFTVLFLSRARRALSAF